MALKPLNSVAGFSVGETPANVIYANGDVTANNFIATAKSNLGPIGNVFVSGGSNNQVIQTDGAGNLSFVTIDTWRIQNGNSNVQVLANSNVTVTIAGNANIATFSTLGLDVNGYVQVQGNVIANGNVSANNYIVTPGSANLIIAPGGVLTRFYSDVNPYSDGGYDLGNGLARWNNVYAYYSNISGNLDVTGNAALGGVLTDNLYYANGQPWDLQEAAGANTQIQYNDGSDNFGASAAFTFDYVGNVLTVDGNAQFNNANLGNLATANYANFTNDLVVQGNIANANNINATNNITSNTANVTGNLTAGNVDGGNLVKANNFSTNGSGGDITLTGGNVAGGNVVIANSFTSNGGTVDFATNNANVQLGSNANVHITGGSSGQVLQTDGAGNLNWYSVSATGIQNGNSNVTITDPDGNVYINANSGVDQQWNFGTNGTLYFPLVNSETSIQEQRYGMGNLVGYNDGGWVLGEYNGANYGTEGIRISPGIEGNVEVILPADQNAAGNALQLNNYVGNVQVNANNQFWYFDNVGVLTTPGNINLNGDSIVGNNGGNIQLYSTGQAKLNYNDDIYAYVQSNGVWLETTGGGNVHLGTDGNVAMSGNLSVTGNIANANNISATNNISANTANITNNLTAGSANITNDLDVGGNIVTGTGSGGNISGVNYIFANVANISNTVLTGRIANGTSNIRLDTDGNITLSSNNLSNVFTFSDVGANVIGYVSANGNGTFGAVYSNTVTAQVGNLTLSSEQSGNSYIQLRTFGDGTVDVGNVRITSLATPNASTDAATKQYVDDVAQGLNVHDAALAATANSLANLTGGVITYNNGSSGVGANLVLSGSPTLDFLSANVFDGNVTAVANSRILVKSEANAATNGIYVVSNSTVLTRALDYDTVPEVEAGDFVFVQDGTTYNDSGWVQTSVVTTIGTDPIIFTQFSGAGTYTAGAGLTLTGTVFSVNTDGITTEISAGNVIVKANAQLTTPNIGAATGTSLDLTGNVIAGNLNSNATITSIDINLTGNVLAANVTANATVSTLDLSATGNILASNITANLTVATTNLNASGNVLAGNINSNAFITAVDGNLTGNLTVGGNITTTGSTGNISGANVIFANSFTSNGGTVDFDTNNANVLLGNVGNVHIYGGTTNQVLTTDGAGNLAWASGSQVANGYSNVSIPIANGNVYINANAGVDQQWVFDTTGNLTSPTGGNIITTGNIFVPVLVQNSSTYDTRISLDSANGIIEANTNGNGTQFLPTGSIRLAGTKQLVGSLFDGSRLTLSANSSLTQIRGGNVKIQVGTGGNPTSTWDFNNDGNTTFPAAGAIALGNLATANYVNVNNDLTAANLTANTAIYVGNTTTTWSTVTTTSVSANQTIASYSATGVTGIEFLVKAIDSGGKYSIATVQAVTDGTNVDYATFGTVQLGGYTGSLAVNVVGGFVRLQVTPASGNSTVWTTQYRLI